MATRKSAGSPFTTTVNIQVSTDEVRNLVGDAADSWRSRLSDEERAALPKGEEGHHSHQWERVICWVLALSDDDYDRIQREGRALVEAVRAADPDTRRRAAAIVPRRESVLAPERGDVVATRGLGGGIGAGGGTGDDEILEIPPGSVRRTGAPKDGAGKKKPRRDHRTAQAD